MVFPWEYPAYYLLIVPIESDMVVDTQLATYTSISSPNNRSPNHTIINKRH